VYPQYRLLVFAKSPVLGAAKTRLQPLLPKEFSLALHCQLVKTVLTQWSESAICPIDCWLAGDENTFREKIMNDDLPTVQALPLYQQKGCDLGERLAHAIKASFTDSSHSKTTAGVFVVGTDCPSLSAQYLQTACSMLEQYDAVIGPADDGGYVLLGLKAANAKLFKDIEWGKSCVYVQTLARLREAKLRHFELTSLSDIDHPQDLVKLKGHAAFSGLLAQAEQLLTAK
jgi:rSAM/selenodomain-associated transferase 1